MINKIQVTIVDDNSAIDYSDIIKLFNQIIDITYIRLDKNVGSGVARQTGINSSNAKYISFVDSDDQLYNPYSIWMLYEKMKQSQCEFVSGSFIREYEPTKDSQYPLSKVPRNQTWVFGRMFSRDFLFEKKITFNDLRYNEDVSFMQLCFAQSVKNEYIDNTIYVQSCNENSITRSKDSIYANSIKGMISFVKALSYSHMKKKELEIVKTNKSKEQMCDGLAVCYWYFIEIINEYSDSDAKKFKCELQKLFNMITDDFTDIIDSELLKNSYFTSMYSMQEISQKYIPSISFNEFLKDLRDTKNTVIIDSEKYQFG